MSKEKKAKEGQGGAGRRIFQGHISAETSAKKKICLTHEALFFILKNILCLVQLTEDQTSCCLFHFHNNRSAGTVCLAPAAMLLPASGSAASCSFCTDHEKPVAVQQRKLCCKADLFLGGNSSRWFQSWPSTGLYLDRSLFVGGVRATQGEPSSLHFFSLQIKFEKFLQIMIFSFCHGIQRKSEQLPMECLEDGVLGGGGFFGL